MIVRRIRRRILLAAMLPVSLVVLLLMAVFLYIGLGDNEDSHGQRARSMARQLAGASEYGLFSGNVGQLQGLVRVALQESAVRSVVILNSRGEIMASGGRITYKMPARLGAQELLDRDLLRGTDLLLQPIAAQQVPLNDLFDGSASASTAPLRVLGHVLLEVTGEKLQQRQLQLLRLSVMLGLAGILLGGLLAVRLGQGVIRPVARVSRLIERIGRGEFGARAELREQDPLRELQQALNQMAERLEVGRDELERRIAQATQELREKKEEAESATLAKSRFLAAASHDLRQPTHALGLFVTRLGQLTHDAQAMDLLANMDRAVQAMRELLDALLDISRLEAGAVPVHVQAFALNDVFDQLKTELALVAAEKGLSLRVRPCNVWVLSDPVQIHRILLNLLSNALRYTRAGSVLLACRVKDGGRSAWIEVWDSGIGIAPEHQEAIFKEFYQVDNPERERSKGLGLGLNIVQRTARLLGHRLQLCSRSGQGSRFRIELPLTAPGEMSDRRGPGRRESFDELVGLVVLVVEDDDLARSALVNLLTSWGATVAEAPGLAVALEQLQRGLQPALIISDYRLPGQENGIQAVLRLRLAAQKEIPACLISGDTDPDLMQAAKVAGLTLMHKPVRPAKLRSLIGRLAKRS
ncbi:MAG: ATP-binding protein [Burkholderiales bacterium]|nr:ATP-binding protein [Burkholderiales bacterium]